MLYFNPNEPAQTILVQLSEPGEGRFLWIKSPYVNREKFIPLGADISPAPARYEAYVIATADINEFSEGFCNYAITKDETLNNILDTGYIYISDNETPEIVRPPDVKKDFVVYGE